MGESKTIDPGSLLFKHFRSEKYSSPEDVSLLGNRDTSISIVKKIIKNYPTGIGEIIAFTSLIFDSWIIPIDSNQYYQSLNVVNYIPPENKHIDFYFKEMIDNYYNKAEERIPYQYIASIVYEMDSLKLLETQKDWEIYTENLNINFAKIISDLDKELIKVTDDDTKKTLENSIAVKKKVINKILSHFELSYIQSQFIKKNTIQAKIIANDAREKSVEAVTNATSAKEIIEDTKRNIYTDFIAILGIFSALIFGLFGGFSAFSSLLQAISSGTKISRAVLLGSLLLIGLLILIFLLLNGIANLTDRNIKSCCSSQKCNHSIYQKFPIFVLGITILILFSGITFLGMIWNFNGGVYKHPVYASLAVIAILGSMLYFVIKMIKDNNNQDVNSAE